MQARRVLLILTLALAATVLGHAAVPTDLRFLAPVLGEFTPEVPVRLPLPRQVIAGAASDFADVRLFDDQGLETPYVIYAQNSPPSYPFPFQVLSYSQSEAGDAIVLQRPQDTGLFWELTVQTTARDFHKAVRLQASHDRATWDEVTADAIFDFSSRIDVRKTTLAFPETDAPYLRLLLTDAVPPEADAAAVQLRYEGLEFSVPGKSVKPFRINGISGRGGDVPAADHVYDRTTFVQPDTRPDTQGNTLVLLGRVNLPVAQFTLTVDNPYYHRRVELWAADTDKDDAYHQVASGVMYKLPGVATADNTLRVQHTQYPYLRLKILNGDNPPLRLQQVEAAWVRQNLYFIPAAGRRYTLYFGGEQMHAPEYELRRLLPAQPARLEQYAAMSLGDVQPHARYNPRPTQGRSKQLETTLLSVVVLVLACGLGFWAYRLLKTATRTKT